MSDTKISEPAPNWCRTCGRRPNDPMAALCLDTHHRTRERLHPQPAELAEQQGDAVDELIESSTRQAKERFEKNEFSVVAESLIICARELKAALATTAKQQVGDDGMPMVCVTQEFKDQADYDAEISSAASNLLRNNTLGLSGSLPEMVATLLQIASGQQAGKAQ